MKVIFSCIKCHITTTMGLFKKIDIELNYDYLITEYLESDEDYLEFYLPDRQQQVFVNDFTNYIIDQADINEDAIMKAFDEWVETEILKYDGYIEVKIDEGCEDYYENKHWCKITTVVLNEDRNININ